MAQDNNLMSRLAERLNGSSNGSRYDGTHAQAATVPKVAPSVDRPIRDRSTSRIGLDNLIRERLRIADPNSPEAVAEALRSLYPTETARLSREVQGVSISLDRTPASVAPPTSMDEDLEEATALLQNDVDALVQSPILADIRPEVRGWANAIHTTVGDGLAAAAAGLDPRQRSRALGSRRALTDFARLARLCSVLNPAALALYRQLAQSLDDVSGILLVRLGQAVTVGTRSPEGVIAMVPAAELQAQRYVVIEALRTLLGAGETVGGFDAWPRGLLAKGRVAAKLRQGAFSDLSVLLEEDGLGRAIDQLIDATVGSVTRGTRSTAAVELQLDALRRLVLVCQSTTPRSANIEAFSLALQDLVDLFDSTSPMLGHRLPYIARPPLLVGRKGKKDLGIDRLIKLTTLRRDLASATENFVAYEYRDNDRTRRQVRLDACLQYLDYATDLYLLGADPNRKGEPEQRASAFGYIAFIVLLDGKQADEPEADVSAALVEMQDTLLLGTKVGRAFDMPPNKDRDNSGVRNTVGRELSLLTGSESRVFDLARRLSPAFARWNRGEASPLLESIKLAIAVAKATPFPVTFTSQVPRDIASMIDEWLKKKP